MYHTFTISYVNIYIYLYLFFLHPRHPGFMLVSPAGTNHFWRSTLIGSGQLQKPTADLQKTLYK